MTDATKTKKEKKPNTITRDSLESKNVNADHRVGRFVITAAVQNAYVNKEFLKSLESYCRENNATLIILGMRPHQRALEKQDEFYDPVLTKYFKSGQLVTSYRFNSNLVAFDIQNVPQLVDPLRGLSELALDNGERISLIVAAPVQAMRMLPGKIGCLPRIAHSTGVVTDPNYQSTRPGKLAEQRHVYGALVIEIDDEIFHLRQLQAHSQDDSIIDLGTRYFPDGTTMFEQAEAIEVGDLHAGETDPLALQFLKELAEVTQPKRVFVQDVFSGASVNHHIENKKIDRSMVPAHIATLAAELTVCGELLKEIKDFLPAHTVGYVKESNHDYFLSRYLNEMRFKDDVQNIEIALELAVVLRQGYNVLQYSTDPDGNWVWLTANASFRVESVEFGQHGHQGVSGSKGSIAGLSKAVGDCFIGHSHTPGIHPGGAWQCGTSTYLRLDYSKNGASTWIHANGVLYKGKQRQIVMLIGTQWRVC